ncbi:LacI family DNA-binding transcriptional regulator [Butyrivibrio sp. NC3005]|uniref:LacI family DNA-binding transcriptional regulator n=1 Tax=Butyrivibrio sp. NC3005 TaxID=1280685 RepID=UPI0003FB5F2E|nr:LacI family DNA-binding transcriptional regulator [Butyrivibrio sp. NC3005]
MMNEKKATVRDIAQKAGVSVATVSYVLNDKKGTKISDATRKKVLQIANLLNYSIPEKYKNIDTKKSTYSIGIMYSFKHDTPSRNIEIMQLINLLAERFGRINFNCQLIPISNTSESIAPVSGLDGIIAIDLSEQEFKRMSGLYFIPILCLDMMINDFLFYQIHTDIEGILEKAKNIFGDDFYLVTDRYCNEGFQKYILEAMPKERVLLFSDVEKNNFEDIKGKKIVALGQALGVILLHIINSENLIIVSSKESPICYGEKVHVIYNDIEKKSNLAMNIIMNALEKKFDVKHEYKIF